MTEKLIPRESVVYTSNSNSYENYLKWCDEKEKVLFELISEIESNYSSLLDIGAGNGELTKNLSSKFSSITVIEPAKKRLKELTNNLINANLNLFNEKFETVKLNGKFDFILSSHSIYYLKDLEQTLKKIKGFLNEKGKFLIVIKSAEGELQEFMDFFRKDVLNEKYGASLKVDKIVNLLKKQGFSVRIKEADVKLTIPSINETINLLDFFYNVSLKEISAGAIINIKSYLQTNFSKEVNFSYPQTIIVATID